MIWRRNWRFSKYGNFSAPAGKFPFGVRRRNLWRKDTGVPGGTVPFRYGEARGIFSFEKRMSPQPPKEKRGGISISPRTPLKRHKGAKLRFLPFGNPSKDKGSGSGKRGRECPLCTPMNAVPPNAGTQLFEEYLSAQPVGDFWILPAVRTGQPYVLGELTALPVNSSRTLFLFHRARRIFFLVFQKENGGCIPHGKAVLLCTEPGQSFQKRISPWLPVLKRHNSASLGKGHFLRQSRT